VSNPLQTKFQIVTSTLLPHKCWACGSEADGTKEFIDFGVSIDYEGAIYICLNCSTEIAHTIGFITSFERDEALLELEKISSELSEAKDNVRAFTDLFVSLNMPIPDDSNTSPLDLGVLEVHERREHTTSEPSDGPFK